MIGSVKATRIDCVSGVSGLKKAVDHVVVKANVTGLDGRVEDLTQWLDCSGFKGKFTEEQQ
eukprot:11158067-Lingulodinium_polyedra.AAC.1